MIHNFTDDQITQLLNKIDQIAQRATQGPWLANDRGIGYEITTQHQIDEAAEVNGWPMPINSGIKDTFPRSDAEFIALARTALPQLAAVIRRLRECAQTLTEDNNDASDYASGIHEAVECFEHIITDAMEADDD